MTIAAQLRVAIALLIAVLVAILLAAFYVPSQLQRSANEKYVEDAIPLRYYVQDLALQTARQQAAVEAYLRTREEALLRRYYTAADASNADLQRMSRCSPTTGGCSRSPARRRSRSPSSRAHSSSRSQQFSPGAVVVRWENVPTVIWCGSRRPWTP